MKTTLIDGNGAMLAAAIEHAADIGLPADRTHAHVQYVQELGELAGVDLVVMPNAALNQLTCQTPLTELLAAIHHALRPGAELLAQVACTHPGGGIDTAGCYDPIRQHGVWFADRYLEPSRAGGAALRRRRQHRYYEDNGADRVRVEFDYINTAGASLHTTSVELRLFSAKELATAFTSAGFGHLRFLPGYGGLSDVATKARGGDARVTGSHTIASPQEYWDRYYAQQFRFGLGTEDILATLMNIPPVGMWVDLGSGSESMLWAIGLRAQRLVAVDADPQRLAMLRTFTSAARPRGAHRTALALCGRTDPHDFSLRCRSLTATVAVDCLTGHPPNDPSLPAAGFELVTQFGLLGLCRDAEHFTDCFTAAHQLVTPGGWAVGANWVARNPYQRVELTERLYQIAAARAGIELLLTRQVPITADPDFTAVWTYIGRKHRHGHRGARHAVSDTRRSFGVAGS